MSAARPIRFPAIEPFPVHPKTEQAERFESVGRLATGVAHDFNNLLTGVLLYCDLLLADSEASAQGRKYAAEIRAACLQASGLVRQLLSIARPQTVVARPLSLNEVAEGMRDLLARLIGETIQLEFRLDPDLGLVAIDPAQAQQILLNLVLNARDALPHGGTIEIETKNCRLQIVPQEIVPQEIVSQQSAPQRQMTQSATSAPCTLFIVSDNGHGMDTPVRSRIFETFFTTKAAGQGTGLGLAIVHDIVTRSGGLIHVDSAPGCGTRVTVLLPQIASSPTVFPLAAQGRALHDSQPAPTSTTKKEPTP
jgi:two-component system, cell cycle sensor histidine kinase and response regulator CckA